MRGDSGVLVFFDHSIDNNVAKRYFEIAQIFPLIFTVFLFIFETK